MTHKIDIVHPIVDTDSILISICGDNLADVVKPEKRSDWETKIVPKWFANESPRSQKEPGLLKSEFSSSTGAYCGLR